VCYVDYDDVKPIFYVFHLFCLMYTVYPEGWQCLRDITMNLPLSVYCQIHRFNYKASCMHRFCALCSLFMRILHYTSDISLPELKGSVLVMCCYS